MKALANRWLSSEDGQDLIEYALLSTFIALVCVAGVQLLETALANVFTVIANQLGVD
jgi:Flp pilus assembly pilin Flp